LAGIPDDRLTRGRAEQGEQDQLPVREISEGLPRGVLRGPAFPLEPREQGRLAEFPTDEHGGRHEDRREKERNPPTPCVEGRGTQAELEGEDDPEGQEKA